MPKPPRFATPAAQRNAVGVVTLLTFAVALGLAQLYTATHQATFSAPLSEQRVGDLKVMLPTDWERAQADGTGQGFVGNVVTLVDLTNPNRYLIITRPVILVPSSPDEVLRDTLNIVTFRKSRLFFDKEKVRRFRTGTMTGAYYIAQSQAPGKQTISSDRFVVLTEDGRRHWVMAMHMPLHPSPQVEAAQDSLMMEMALSAVDTGCRDASLPELEAAGLASIAKAGARVRHSGNAVEGESLYITLDDPAVPHLGLLRVQPQLDAQNITPAAPLSPLAGMVRHYSMVHGRTPAAKDLSMLKVADRSATRLMLSDGQERSLHRELLHVNINEDQALLLDMLAEAPAVESMNAKMTGLIQDFVKEEQARSAPPAAPAAAPGGALMRAMERGRALATAQREQMIRKFTAQRKAYLLRREGAIIGTQITDRMHMPEQGLPLRSRKMRAVVIGDETRVTWANWFVSLDGKTIESTIASDVRDGPIQQSYSYVFSLKDQMLSASTLPPRPGGDPIWSQKVDAGYLPGFAEDSWDLSALARLTAEGPVLVWRSRDTQRPEPHWLEYATVATGPLADKIGLPAQGFAYVQIRPMMSVDGQRLWLDREGIVIASEWSDSAKSPTGGVRLSLTPTDLQTVNRLYASQEFLRFWQQDVDQP